MNKEELRKRNRESSKKRYYDRKQKGLCTDCGQPVTKGILCEICKVKPTKGTSKIYFKRKEQRVCTVCGSPDLKNRTSCVTHYLMQISKAHLGSRKRYQELITLMEKQNWKCALTGQDITFKDDLHLDHIVPKSKGGTNDIENLRWVIGDANEAKRGLLDEDVKILFSKMLDTMNGYQKIYFWKVEYVYGEQIFKTEQISIPNVGDFVYLFDDEFRILSVRYFPEKGIVYVSLTKGYYL